MTTEPGRRQSPETAAATSGPQRTPDGRYLVVNGRRWRAADPGIPEKLRVELVAELMAARRLVRTDEAQARPRVQDAKVALGERGEEWWAPTPEGRRARMAATIRALLRHRDGTTICPSDVARVVGGEGWRRRMDEVRRVVAVMARDGEVVATQRGSPVQADEARGPIRVARTSTTTDPQEATT